MENQNEVDWNRLRNIVLQRFRAKWSVMSEYMRNLPTVVFTDPATLKEVVLSPNDAIREVEVLSERGKQIISAEVVKMRELQPE